MPLSIKVEPYWNVKETLVIGGVESDKIKVEPYWNVKDVSPP